ncbi:MAG: polysaccharide biosynthesis C-terminal domain-containing protein, partial [Clostridia bacterium]|nr:polysaccharide biosynthesis C-terminal domain-containing protein [Clostridia bacterium]
QLFIDLWLGEAYRDAYLGVLLVIIPGMFYNSMQIASTTLIVRDKAHVSAIVNAVVGVVNIILSFVLSYKLGMIGSCISIFIAYTLRAILYIILFKKTLKLNMWMFIKECYIKTGIPVVVSLAAGYIIKHFLNGTSWFAFFINGALIVLAYITLIAILGTSRQEKKTVIKKIKGFLKIKK